MIVGLLSFFDERPDWLCDCVTGLAQVEGVEALVAVDGHYLNYPSESESSPDSNYEAIEKACQDTGLELHYHSVSPMTEVDKRSYMFAAAEKITTEDDYYFVIDADEFVEFVDGPLNITGDAAEITLYEPDTGETINLRCIFRALRGLRVHHNHHTFAVDHGDGEATVLWGMKGQGELEAVDSNIIASHYTHQREERRTADARVYYEHRDTERIERFKCFFCGDWRESNRLPWGWRMTGRGLTCDWAGCCTGCYPAALDLSEKQLAKLKGTEREIIGIPDRFLPPGFTRL